MYSDALKAALERNVVTQRAAIAGVVRGVTRVASGLTPSERPLCAYLLMGPLGTGKTHLVRTLARILHDDSNRVTSASCHWVAENDPWSSLVTQLVPLFADPMNDRQPQAVSPPLSILLIEDLDCAPAGVCKSLARVLETGHIMLPGGRPARLKECIVFLTTSGLCAAEILDESARIGFSGTGEAPDEQEEQGRLHRVCLESAVKHLGSDIMGQVDDLLVFHRLEQSDLSQMVDLMTQRLNDWLQPRDYRCELRPAARDLLLTRGMQQTQFGARDLILAHRRLVEFPVADLLVSGQIPRGGKLIVDRHGEEAHLHFTVEAPDTGASPSGCANAHEQERQIPVT